MQQYNPNNPVNKYKSVKTDMPSFEHSETNNEISEKKNIPRSYGLYIPPPLFEKGMYQSVTYLQYISSTIDSKDRDYTKYPNPFNFITEKLPEFYKNTKIFQMYYISLPQFNLLQQPITNESPNYADLVYMQTYISTQITTPPVTLNQEITNTTNDNVYTICNNANNEYNFIINNNISIVYTINNIGNFYMYGFSSSYKLNSNPYIRLTIPEVIYSPIMTTDKSTYTFFVRMSRARNYIAYASVRAPTKVFKEHTLINLPQLTFKFADSTGQPLSIDYLDKHASNIDDPTNFSSKYNYIRHPLFYWHQIIMGVRIGVIRNSLK
jgi:hypothetical protein